MLKLLDSLFVIDALSQVVNYFHFNKIKEQSEILLSMIIGYFNVYKVFDIVKLK